MTQSWDDMKHKNVPYTLVIGIYLYIHSPDSEAIKKHHEKLSAIDHSNK
jgi:hypothetical protein